ncbi:MAG: helix-hairpin-helix domain-containing protein [Alistipes sp.]|nr:helix-hairpin-helix domain-containing protein [Alistipes senegalensis]MCM1249884.1 helix-hairpin-helix domain-containing protein [Alistipes sp.]
MKPLFTEREIRALAVFLPLALLALAGLLLVRPRHDIRPARQTDMRTQMPGDTLRPKPFDPNTVTYDELRGMGLGPDEAAGLIRYRSYGKIFRIPEDVATCRTIDDSLYRRLAPCIRIGRRYAAAPPEYRPGRIVARPLAPEPFRIDTVSARYLRAIGAMSEKQAKVFVRWRDTHPIYNKEELCRCYVVSDSLAAALEPYILFMEPEAPEPAFPLALNRADSALLLHVHGIGPRTAGRIVRYRERLGGYVRKEQLAEVQGITESNYEKILRQIYCDSCEIRKIHINFATADELAAHPYMAPRLLRKILKKRQLKGGWSTAEELYDEHILEPDEACRLVPYLSFERSGGSDDE